MSPVPVLSLLALAALAPDARGEDGCPPLAAVEGPDEGLVSAVEDGLSSAGIALADAEDEDQWRCPRLAVHVEEGAGKIRVDAIDRAGRTLSRAVASAETAAVLIESWVSAEYGAPRRPSDEASEMVLVVRPEAAVGNDAAWIGGVDLGVCVRVAGMCLDFDMRAGVGRLGLLGLEPAASRVEMGLSIGVSDAIAVGPVDLAAGVAIGGRWVHTRTDAGARCTTGETCPLADFVERLAVEVDTIHPAIELSLGVRFPLDPLLAVEARGSAQLMPASPEGPDDLAIAVSDDNFYVIRFGVGARWGL